MRTRTAKPISGVAQALAYGVLVGIALILMATSAKAHASVDRSDNPVSQQWQLADQMTQATMLAALGYNSERVVRQIEEMSDLFSRRLLGLRGADAELGLVTTGTPDMLVQIARLEAVWPRYDATLKAIITDLRTAPRVDETLILDLTELHKLVIEAVDDTADAFARQPEGRLQPAGFAGAVSK